MHTVREGVSPCRNGRDAPSFVLAVDRHTATHSVHTAYHLAENVLRNSRLVVAIRSLAAAPVGDNLAPASRGGCFLDRRIRKLLQTDPAAPTRKKPIRRGEPRTRRIDPRQLDVLSKPSRQPPRRPGWAGQG